MQYEYIVKTPYWLSVKTEEFQHTDPDTAKPPPDQPYVGHFSTNIYTYEHGFYHPYVLQDCFLRLIQAEINSIANYNVVTPEMVTDKLSIYILPADKQYIENQVYQAALVKENPWIDPELMDRVLMIRKRWDYLKYRQERNNPLHGARTQGQGHYKLEISYVDESKMIFMPAELLRECLVAYQHDLNMALPQQAGNQIIAGNDPTQADSFLAWKTTFHEMGCVDPDDVDTYWEWIELMYSAGRNHWYQLPLGRELTDRDVSLASLDDYLMSLPEHSMTSQAGLHHTSLTGSTSGGIMGTVTTRWDPRRLFDMPPGMPS
jgi:hypothetical protein